MRNRMKTALMLVLTGAALAQYSAGVSGDETTSTDQAKDAAASKTVAEAEKSEEFKPPPGYLPKRRGDKVVYCTKNAEIGTRVKSEKCYEEDQIRNMILERDKANRDFEQRRRICSDPSVCAAG